MKYSFRKRKNEGTQEEKKEGRNEERGRKGEKEEQGEKGNLKDTRQLCFHFCLFVCLASNIVVIEKQHKDGYDSSQPLCHESQHLPMRYKEKR